MEQLISFLIHNFYFVIVAVGIIYSLFFRKSPLERRPPNRMPDFGGGGKRLPRRPGEPGASVPTTSLPEPAEAPLRAPRRQTPLSVARPQQQPVRAETRLMETTSAPLPVPVAASSKSRSTLIPTPSASTAAGTEVRTISREDLTRAVVWAEILGPPRARRPYRR